jgi:histidinol dehydrogenase
VIKIRRWAELMAAERTHLLERGAVSMADATAAVAPILAEVKQRGDAALYDYAQKFDGATITTGLKARDEDFAAAYRALDESLIAAMRLCIGHVEAHHRQQMARVEPFWLDEIAAGIYGGEKITPVDSVGLYVPRGKGAFPSMMYMLCVPAKLAGVTKIVVCTPPTPEGGIDAASLVAADLCGVRDVYKVGGAQAIAALAYGTATIPKVAMVQGPGSPYVAAAKQLLSDVIHPGMPAGPTDAMILADHTAHPENTAWDVLNEAEHGPDSASLLVTTDGTLAEQVAAILPRLVASLPEPRRSYCTTVLETYGGIMLCADLAEAIELVNLYAAEHLLLKLAQPAAILPQIKHAGEILIGEATPMVLGNYGIGVNAVLPTGGQARAHSALSVWSFLKRTSIACLAPTGFDRMAQPVAKLADYEGFPAHAQTIRSRARAALKEPDLIGLLRLGHK